MSNCEAIEIVRSTICSLFNLEGIGLKKIARGYSSAGRAPALQAGGRRFDPDYLHQQDQIEAFCDAKCFDLTLKEVGKSAP